MPFQPVDIPPPISLSFDLSPYELPVNVWSDGINMRFRNGTARKILGEVEALANPPEAPIYIRPWFQAQNQRWIWGSQNKLYLWDSASHTDVSRAAGYSNVTDPYFWQGDTFSGLSIENNGLDEPQMLDQTGTQYVDLPNWPSTFRAKIIRPHKNRLFALNLTESGTEYPFRLMWSDNADPGLPPPNWDIADPASRAGDVNLSSHDGEIIDALSLADQLLIYRADSIHAARFIGGNFSFQFYTLFERKGILAPGCVTHIDLGHFVVGPEDMYITDGRGYEVVGNQRVREWFYSQIDGSNVNRVFVTAHKEFDEVWICFPSYQSTNGECDLALIYNYEERNWTTRQLPNIRAAEEGLVESIGTPIIGPRWSDYPTETWEDMATIQWGGPTSTNDPTNLALVMASNENTKFYQSDVGEFFDGNPFVASIERYGIDLENPGNIKHVTRLVPRMLGGAADFWVGGEYAPGEGILYEGPYRFTPGVDQWINCRVSGRYLAMKVQSAVNQAFELSGFSFEVDQEGPR